MVGTRRFTLIKGKSDDICLVLIVRGGKKRGRKRANINPPTSLAFGRVVSSAD